MVAYERFAAFYDVVMDDPGPRAARVNAAIDRYRPMPGPCSNWDAGPGRSSPGSRPGPGSPVWTGHREMLAIAATKVPGAQLLQGDMSDFDIGRRFDVVACVFDSINHLLDVGSWASLFACVHRHLADGGLFVFDVNTVGELHRLGDEPPWVYDFGGGTAVIDVSFALDPAGLGVTDWDIRIFEKVTETRYELHHERIGELALPLERVRELGCHGFELLEEVDEDGLPASDTSVKAYYALRRRD